MKKIFRKMSILLLIFTLVGCNSNGNVSKSISTQGGKGEVTQSDSSKLSPEKKEVGTIPSTSIEGDSAKLTVVGPPDITKELTNLAIKYEGCYKDIKHIPNPVGNIEFVTNLESLSLFYKLFHNGGILDLKNQGWEEEQYIFQGKIVDKDAPGNILYGYVGSSFNYDWAILLSAAGFAQVKAKTNEPEFGNPLKGFPFGDDPRDQSRIMQGINWYRETHGMPLINWYKEISPVYWYKEISPVLRKKGSESN